MSLVSSSVFLGLEKGPFRHILDAQGVSGLRHAVTQSEDEPAATRACVGRALFPNPRKLRKKRGFYMGACSFFAGGYYSGMAKKSLPTLDLHGFQKDDVFDAVDRFIMKYHSQNRVKILPGKGEGIVRAELLRYLKAGGYPWEYEEMPNGSRNTGSVIVFL